MKHLGTLLWTVILSGSLACVISGYLSAQTFHSQTIAQLQPAPKVRQPPPDVEPRDVERELVGAHSFVMDDDEPPPIEDVVVKRYGDWAPPLEETAVAPHPRLALIVTDCGRALTLDAQFAALPAALTLAVDPDGGQTGELVRMLGDRRVLVAIPNAIFDNPANVALAELGARYASINAVGALSPLSGSIDGSAAVRVLSRLPGTSVIVDGMADSEPTVYRYARERGLPALTRDIIVDARDGPAYAEFMLKQAAALALHSGVAVAVARSRPETLAAIQAELPVFQRDGIEVVPVDALVAPVVTQR